MGTADGAGETGWGDDLAAKTPVLRSSAWSLSHDLADADDRMHETLAKAWSHHDRIVPGANLRTWLVTILRNTIYCALVRRWREARDEDGAFAAHLTTRRGQHRSVSVGELRRAPQQLRPTRREALVWSAGRA